MADNSTKTCFVVMGFGKKTDFESGRVLDLDKSYRNMIKPAVEAAGLKCVRADEIVHSGMIDVPMYEQLLNADVVVADLSTSNQNAFYELGIRHALRPFTTVVVAEDGIKKFPFDIGHVAIRQYHHLGEDIGFDEVMRFREELTKAVKEIMDKDPRDNDSPVYTFLNGLTPPAMAAARAAKDAVDQHKAAFTESSPADSSALETDQTHSMLMQQVDEAQKKGDWVTAKALLTLVRQRIKDEITKKQEGITDKAIGLQEDPYILQRLALATYKSKLPNEKEALIEAHHLLNLFNPGTSNDTETLGLWGAVHKRLFEITKEPAYLDEAIRAYQRGFFIRNDYYNGINYAFLLNVRASQATDPAEAIADFIEARRVRKEVLLICEQWLKANPIPDESQTPEKAFIGCMKDQYWAKATEGEAQFGLGDETKATETLEAAYKIAPEAWMTETTKDQISKLKLLLEDPPLKYIK